MTRLPIYKTWNCQQKVPTSGLFDTKFVLNSHQIGVTDRHDNPVTLTVKSLVKTFNHKFYELIGFPRIVQAVISEFLPWCLADALEAAAGCQLLWCWTGEDCCGAFNAVEFAKWFSVKYTIRGFSENDTKGNVEMICALGEDEWID